MGSEWLIIGYSITAFLSLILFKIFNDANRNQSVEEQLERKIDPISIMVMILSIGIFVFSIIGMGKGVIESYDHCSIMKANETISGNVTSFEYERVCFDNDNNGDETFYKMGYVILDVFVAILIIGFIWTLFVWLKGQWSQKGKNILRFKRR